MHINLIARDWERLSHFLHEVFGCVLVPYKRESSGDWFYNTTRFISSRISGMPFRFPDMRMNDPLSSCFSTTKPGHPIVNPSATGFSRIAFVIDSMVETSKVISKLGNFVVSELTVQNVLGVGLLECEANRN